MPFSTHETVRMLSFVETNPRVRRVLDFIRGNGLCNEEAGVFNPILDELEHHDRFMLLADFEDYVRTQEAVDGLYLQPDEWTKKSILNVARCGYFSSDRAVKEYAERIWKL